MSANPVFSLANLTPNPHPTGDQPSATAQAIALANYTPAPIIDPGIPELESYFDGLRQIDSDIESNAQARPSFWGETSASDNTLYRLHLNDNGMLVTQWTINWGDGSAPQVVTNTPWVIHPYAGIAADYTITVTATSLDGSFDSSSGGDDSPSASGLAVQVNDVAPSLRVIGAQVASSGQAISLPNLGVFTHPSGSGGFTYQIDWGDGSSPDTGQATIVDQGSNSSPLVGSIGGEHTYDSGGDYFAAVTVTDSSGFSDTQTLEITVNQSVTVSPVQTPPPINPNPIAPVTPPLYGDPGTPVDPGNFPSTIAPPAPTQSQGGTPVLIGPGLPIDIGGGTSTNPGPGTDPVSGTDPNSPGTPPASSDEPSGGSNSGSTGQTTTSPSETSSTESSFIGPTLPTTSDSLTSPVVARSMVSGVDTTATSDPALLVAVRQALGLAAGAHVMSEDWARLTSLSADSNQVLSLDGLQYAVNLQSLTLVPSNFADPGHLTDLSPLSGLNNLTSLTLQDCGLDATALSSLPSSYLPSLTSLDLRYNNIAILPTEVAVLPMLNSLYVYGNPLGNNPRAGLAVLAGLLLTVDIAPDHPENAVGLYDVTDASTAQNVYNDLADAFYDLPLAIYSYVVNTIKYDPYQGAMKGPMAVLQTGSGNDWDTNALLNVLLQRASEQAVIEGNNEIDTSFVWDRVLEALPTTEQRLGIRTVAGVYDVLAQAGLNPTLEDKYGNACSPSTMLSTADLPPVYIAFDHSWLETSITPPGSITPIDYALDPSWKLLDLQPGVTGILSDVPFSTNGSTGSYLSTEQDETAAEFYEAQVESYLATNDPNLTIADVPYTGPIHQQTITALPTTLPYAGLGASPSSDMSIPSDFIDQVKISVAVPETGTITGTVSGSTITLTAPSGTFASWMATEQAPIVLDNTPEGSKALTITSFISSTQVVVQGDTGYSGSFSYTGTFSVAGFSSLQEIPVISLEQITIGYPSGTLLTPHLYINGVDTATSLSSATSGGNIDLVVQVIPESAFDGGLYAGTNVYTRAAGDYLAVGLDAGQMSNQLLVDDRQVVNDANVNEANNSAWAGLSQANQDQLTGGLLNLAMVEFYLNSDQADATIGGLTGAMPVYNCIANGIATADSGLSAAGDDLQIRYLPSSMGLDVAGANWNSTSTDEAAVTSLPGVARTYAAEDIAHYAIMGYTSSALEALTLEDLTNTPSISTVKSLQTAYQSSTSVITINAANVASVGVTLLLALPSQIQSDIENYVLNKGDSVLVPTQETTIGTGSTEWQGVGYFLTSDNGSGIDVGNIIDGSVGGVFQAPHGGFVGDDPDPAPSIPSPFTVGDPIEIGDGSVINDASDISIPNLGTPLSFSRHYSSDTTVGPGETAFSDRGMGEGWSFTYSDTMTLNTDSSLTWFTDEGVELNFTPKTGGGYNNPPTMFGTLTTISGGYLWTDTTGSTVTFTTYGSSTTGYVTQISDRYGNGVAIARDSTTTDITTVSDLVNTSRYLTFTYTGNHITAITDFTGRTWTYGYNSAGRLVSVTAPISSSTPLQLTQYSYYAESSVEQGLLQAVTDADGNQTQFTYYVNRRGFQVTDAQGNTNSVSHDIYRDRTDFTDQLGQNTSFFYDSTGDETRAVNPDGTSIAYTWSNGLPTSVTDAYGQVTTNTYDANGNLIQSVDPLGNIVDTSYTTYANPTSVTTIGMVNPSESPVVVANQTLTTATTVSISLIGYTVNSSTVLTFDFSSSAEGTIQSIGLDNSAGTDLQQFALYGTNTTTGFQDFHTYVSTDGVVHYVIPIGDFLTGSLSAFVKLKFTQSGSGAQSSYSNIRIYDAEVATTEYTYQTDGSLTSVKDADGNVTKYYYPGSVDVLGTNRGLPVATTSANGTSAASYTTWFEYNTAGQVTTQYTPVATGPNMVPPVAEALGPFPTNTPPNDWIIQSFTYDAIGDLLTSVDGNGASSGDAAAHTTTYTYDVYGDLTSETQPDPDGSGSLSAPVTIFVHDAVGHLISTTITTASPQQTTSTVYNTLGQAVENINPDGTYTTAQYDPAGNLVYQTDAMGRVTQAVFDDRDRAIDTIRPDGSIVRTEYDGGGRVVGQTDPLGNTTLFVYDKLGRKIEQILPDPDGSGPLTAATTRYGYDPLGNLAFVTDALGTSADDLNHSTDYTYDKLGHVLTVTEAAPTSGAARPETIYTYDDDGNLKTVTDPRGEVTTYDYDEANRKISETESDPDGSGPLGALTTSFYYDHDSNLIAVVNPLGSGPTDAAYTTQFVYDNLNRKIEEIDPDPDGSGPLSAPVTTSAYGQNGTLSSTTDPNGNTTHFLYNLEDEQTAVTDALGDTTTTIYDAVGNALFVTDALGRITAYQYDALNRKTSETDPLPDWTAASAPQTTWQYDANGSVTAVTDPLGNVTRTQYNAWNEPIAVTDALGYRAGDPQHTVNTAYDELGRVSTVTDQLGRTTQYVYDNLSRKIETIAPDPNYGTIDSGSPKTYYGYDANGNLWYTTDALGAYVGDPAHTTWNSYDGLNRLTTVVDALANTTFTSDVTPTSQPAHSTLTTYDALGNVATVTNELGQMTTYEYDHLNRKIEEIDPDPTTGIEGTGSPITHFTYDADSNVLSTTDPDGNTTYTTYDALNRAVRSVSALGSGPNDTHYATTTVYNAVGNIQSVIDPDGNVTSYVYDRLNRETEVIDPLSNVSSTKYDADGNVIQTTDNDHRVIDYVYDPLNRQVEEDWLDANSQVFHTIQNYYDAAGQLIGVTETDTGTSLHTADPSDATNYYYTYDQDGRLKSSRMAPGDLGTYSPGVNTGSLGDGVNDATIDWNQDGVNEVVDYGSLSLTSGNAVTLDLSSSAFAPTLVLLPPSALTWSGGTLISINWNKAIINAGGGGNGNARLTLTANETGTWLVFIASDLTSAPANPLAYTLTVGLIVPTALTELDYTYYADGSVHTVIDTSNMANLSGKSGTTTYGYDAVDQLTQITNQNSSGASGITNKYVQLAYNNDGSLDTVTRYNGLTSAASVIATTSYRTTGGSADSGYDDMGRLTAMQQTFGSTTHTYTWQYDSASNITGSTSPDGSDTNTLDASNQIETASLTSESYSYDQNGNRTDSGYVTGANNLLLSDGTYTYVYDADGNRTEKFIDVNHTGVLSAGDTNITLYAWDDRNRLVSETFESTYGTITDFVLYTYDYANREIGSYDFVAGDYTYTVYDGQNPYLVVSDPNQLENPTTNTTATISQRDLYAQAVDEIMATDNDLGTVLWGLDDNEGTPRDMVNSSGVLVNHVEYTSFGAPTAGTSIIAGFAFGEAGMRYDLSTQEYVTAARRYDPTTGRFDSNDPSGFASGTTNLSAYVGNNPATNSDPSGLHGDSAVSAYNSPSSYGLDPNLLAFMSGESIDQTAGGASDSITAARLAAFRSAANQFFPGTFETDWTEDSDSPPTINIADTGSLEFDNSVFATEPSFSADILTPMPPAQPRPSLRSQLYAQDAAYAHGTSTGITAIDSSTAFLGSIWGKIDAVGVTIFTNWRQDTAEDRINAINARQAVINQNAPLSTFGAAVNLYASSTTDQIAFGAVGFDPYANRALSFSESTERIAGGTAGYVGSWIPIAGAATSLEALASTSGADLSVPSAGSVAPTTNPLNILNPEFVPNAAALNKVTAFEFYTDQAAFSTDQALRHMAGIDFNQPVTIANIPAGTTLQQGVGPFGMGNYFSPPGTTALEAGIGDAATRATGLFQSTSDLSALRSTAAPDYLFPPGEVVTGSGAGGGIQYFIPKPTGITQLPWSPVAPP